jgi:Protein of unknown function (DUF1580)
MIDCHSEHVISFPQASDESPRRRKGRKIHVSCFYRWSTVGCRGVILETIQIGGNRCTSREALMRFYARLSESRQAGAVGGGQPQPGPGVGGRTLAQRQRASAEAGRKLAELGA